MNPQRIVLYDGYGNPIPGEWWVLYYKVRNEWRPVYWQQK